MCVVSMVVDSWNEKWSQPQYPFYPGSESARITALEKEVEFLKLQIQQAKKYDKDNEEPDCEDREKIAKLKELAAVLDLDISDVLEILEAK